MKKFNVGIIGYGWAATAHIAALNATGRAQVTAICSARKLDAAALSAQYGTPIATYTDLKAMLKDPSLHVIDITSHPWKHKEHAIAAARAGKHIILEKPMSLSWADCKAVEAAVKKAKVKFALCFECRYSAQFLATKSLLDQGLLGDLHYGEVDYYHGIGPWYGQFGWNVKKNGGGSALLSAGCHALDALLLCLGDDVAEVTSYATGSGAKTFKPYEYDTTSVTILKFKSGKVGKCASVIDCLQPYYFHTHLVGSNGSLLDNKVHLHGVAGLNKAKWSQLSFGLVDSGDVADHPYQKQFEAFFDALAAGKEMPLTGLKEALRTHEVIFAADKSAATGKPVKLR
jgi:UDP-N-acetyl-2-amino-2-deoxyglucuronate dehydrogenase